MRGQWSEHEARGVLAAWRKSGLSIEKFGKERAITPQRIRWWKNKLEGVADDDTPAAGSMALLPLSVVAPVATPKRGEPVAVYLRGGQVIRVGRGFDEEAFKRVVAILEGA
jgi:transposase